jgi:hypothetical protein
VLDRLIDDAGHFPWIENTSQVRAAFNDLTDRILSSNSRRRQGAPHGGTP